MIRTFRIWSVVCNFDFLGFIYRFRILFCSWNVVLMGFADYLRFSCPSLISKGGFLLFSSVKWYNFDR